MRNQDVFWENMAREGKAHVLNDAEFKRMLIIIKAGRYAKRDLALVYCSFGLGLRVKEIAALTIADVADNHYQLLDELFLTRSMTKGNKQRVVYLINKKVRDALQLYLNELLTTPRQQPLFRTQRKSRFTPNTMQKWFKNLYDKTGITGASSHSGRRTFITRLIEQGTDIKAVAVLAGHCRIESTGIYVEANPDR